VEWDGKVPHAIFEKDGRIFVMLCGHPKDGDWQGVSDRVDKVLLGARHRVASEGCQRRGAFINASKGVTIGQGGQVSAANALAGRCLLTCDPAAPRQHAELAGNSACGG
jgi:hypothetical protein